MVTSQGQDNGLGSTAWGCGAEHTAFQPLEQSAFQALEHIAFPKGLLKPFKGKGELVEFGEQCSALAQGLIALAIEKVLAQAERYPFTLLPIRLVKQSTGAGTVFLRWCRADRSRMGTDLWRELILDEQTPINLISDLYALELQRIVINMQISLVHSMGRQAFLCANKVEAADKAYLARLAHHTQLHAGGN
ncbi:DUF3158 family protein [Pseudomonas vanderleydeniana]|uniref:DUF3158 family protein n=1 Tax=Pseudomonas vanderleydeniana TaxID=2745495 RepID=A0A9E6TQD5_9PSED|nr:DUF3158 family protein [Pseudomonas vanderleydeniana]QXI26411.1 DUF3158 family protein [Pseudomonas vanderleydeniana]